MLSEDQSINYVLWCGDGAVVGYKSADEHDPERDKLGWVMDWRWTGMSMPTHFMKVTSPS
jgi:hypothetical protein